MRNWFFDELTPLSYDLIVADPPWDYENYSEKGEKKGPRAQYETMTVGDISSLPVGDLARGDTLLLCWGTAPLFPQQIVCVQRWGFTYKTFLVWRKVFASGKRAMGPGYRVRTTFEPVIVATMGAPKHKPFMGDFSGVRREHSRKPEEFYEMVEDHTNAVARLDLFSRQTRPGWTTWGDQRTKFDDTTTGATSEASAQEAQARSVEADVPGLPHSRENQNDLFGG